MTAEAWLAVAVAAVVVILIALDRVPPDAAMVGGLTALLLLRLIDPQEALGGFANEGLATIAVLYVVAAALRETGGMALVAGRLLGRPRSVAGAQARMMLPTAAMSAFMNNTPLVAMMLPVVDEWAQKVRVPVSKLMMPLSFAAILGGLCTLIGTSTNLVVSGLVERSGRPPLHLFDVTWVGLPCCVAGLAYILAASRWLLPDRTPALDRPEDPRNYTVEMLVERGSALVGQTIEAAGLRHLPGLYLMEIDRRGEVLAAVGSETRLAGGDRLVFVGVVESVVDLQKVRGLAPATDQVFKLDAPRSQRCLIEAVVSDSCPGVGRSIREGRFRAVYNAAVIAVARNGERVPGKMGDVVLRAGDTLLLEAHPSFVESQRNSRDFYLVSQVEDSTPPRHERAWVALGILAAMVVAAGTGGLSMFQAALLAAGALVLTRCVSPSVARRGVDWSVLVVSGCAFGIGRALETTGAAEAIAQGIIGLAGGRPWLALAAVYLVTMLFTEVMSNIASAVVVFPFALATAAGLGVSPMPFVMAITIAASCGFATPIGYQTHLMVYGPGGYRFLDFVRFGGLLNLVVMAVAVAVAPLAYPF